MNKQAYQPPVLKLLGSVSELTQVVPGSSLTALTRGQGF